MDAKLEAVPLVDIDDEGRFKYILIKVYGREQADGTEPSKLIVRGYKRAQWHGKDNGMNWIHILLLNQHSAFNAVLFSTIHSFCYHNVNNTIRNSFVIADIYDEVTGSIRALGLDTECLGGGRIEHFPQDKLLKVYGYSTVSLK